MSLFKLRFVFQSLVPASGWFIWYHREHLKLAGKKTIYLTTKDVPPKPFIQAFLICYGLRNKIHFQNTNPRFAATMLGLAYGTVVHELYATGAYNTNRYHLNYEDGYNCRWSYGSLCAFIIGFSTMLRFLATK